MRRLSRLKVTGEDLYVGLDLHKVRWHVTNQTAGLELFCSSIPGEWEALQRILDRYKGNKIQAVYVAGCLGFWLYDQLVEHGLDCIVTP